MSAEAVQGGGGSYTCSGGRNRTDYPLYKTALNDVFKGIPRRISLYDVDLVLEVDGQYRAIFEWKEYEKTYNSLSMPFFEYVGLKKLAKLLHVQPYLIVLQGGKYYVVRLDRFEDPRNRKRRIFADRQYAVFDMSEGLEMDAEQLREYLRAIAVGA